MSWWDAGSKTADGTDEVLGDDSADAVGTTLAQLGNPPLQEMMDALAAALRTKPEFVFQELNAQLAGRPAVKADATAARPAMTGILRRGIDSLFAVYQDGYERNPTLNEILQNFVFVLGFKPERFLAGMEGVEIDDIASK
jgi:hypothetical protein